MLDLLGITVLSITFADIQTEFGANDVQLPIVMQHCKGDEKVSRSSCLMDCCHNCSDKKTLKRWFFIDKMVG
ncbi:hypothetical protein Nepgr_028475 [Nepenthes gracilis]|uniref:Uncharacterized protein n=1 Tax=Nepenthes gracilis TaxID=150966 RepID=A0AAD3TC43_NEPGR|nr:hypothetical protein Nepgr_028475 [Nepenthes gracilis]